MKIVEKTELVERVSVTYIARDGREFAREYDCRKWELELDRRDAEEEVKHLVIDSMNDRVPINCDTNFCESSYYTWYNVNNEADFEMLQKLYNGSLTAPKAYPEVICVETLDDEPYDYHMSDMFEITKGFWRGIGYKVTFEKEV